MFTTGNTRHTSQQLVSFLGGIRDVLGLPGFGLCWDYPDWGCAGITRILGWFSPMFEERSRISGFTIVVESQKKEHLSKR